MGCGASSQGSGQKSSAAGAASGDAQATPVPTGEELTGKQKYIGELGAAVMTQEERKIAVGMLLAFIPAAKGFAFSFYNQSANKVFAAEFTDAELETLKTSCGITYGWSAFFKSISTELQRGKAKIATTSSSVTVEIVVSTIKEKATQNLILTLPDVGSSPVNLQKFVIIPMTNMVQKKRQASEERDKEVKASRTQVSLFLSEVNVAKHRSVVARITPLIVPLREESARHTKITSELTAKVAQKDRKIKQLQRGKGTNVLDAMYSRGGPQPYMHLHQADEHVPRVVELADEPTLTYLQHSMPMCAEGVALVEITRSPADPRLLDLHSRCPPDMVGGVLKVFTRLDDWDLNVFELEKATGNNALFYVTYAILYKLDLVRHFNIDDQVLRTFLAGVQAGYHPNPYHSATHAADVAHINYFIMTQAGLAAKTDMTKEELFAAMIAGAIHDYDHPGFNNNFHTRTGAYLSTLYNDKSILENHHLACITEMMRIPRYNILASFSEDQRKEVRETMIEMVLSTDMGNHGRYFGTFRRRLSERPDWTSRANAREDAKLAFSMSLKMSDISNTGRPNHLYLEWAKNIATEFYNQGDAEAKLGLTISPFMDRSKEKAEFSKGQISFMNYIVVPMLEALSEFLPRLELALKHCTENKEYWQHHET